MILITTRVDPSQIDKGPQKECICITYIGLLFTKQKISPIQVFVPLIVINRDRLVNGKYCSVKIWFGEAQEIVA